MLDGETRVGLVHGEAHTLELVNFRPEAPRAVEYPALYHAPTAPGDRLTLADWVEWNQKTTSERHELRLSGPDSLRSCGPSEGGETLTVTFEEWFGGEDSPPCPPLLAGEGGVG